MERAISAPEVRAIQLRVLADFAEWCSAHNLRFQLAFGTLLGAVRHDGFIPWDDDVDIAMPREDYELFCQNFCINPPAWLTASSLATNSNWPLAFAKVWDIRTVVDEYSHLHLNAGVGLDVFPIDQVAKSLPWRLSQKSANRVGRSLENVAAIRPREGRSRSRAAVLALTGPVVRRVGPGKVARLRTRVVTAGQGTKDRVSIFVGPYDWSVPHAAMTETIPMTFETLTLPVPVGTPTVLTAIYGNYMAPPPAEKQVTHHTYDARWSEHSSGNEETS